jgi:hypothetical protein
MRMHWINLLDTMTKATPERSGFIREIVAADVREGRVSEVVTRFPPKPNGYLHIGHPKAIALNFGIAQEVGGRCHLRFDTNSINEEQEYIDSIQQDIRWLGFDWGEHLYFASDYFHQLKLWVRLPDGFSGGSSSAITSASISHGRSRAYHVRRRCSRCRPPCVVACLEGDFRATQERPQPERVDQERGEDQAERRRADVAVQVAADDARADYLPRAGAYGADADTPAPTAITRRPPGRPPGDDSCSHGAARSSQRTRTELANAVSSGAGGPASANQTGRPTERRSRSIRTAIGSGWFGPTDARQESYVASVGATRAGRRAGSGSRSSALPETGRR